MAATVTVVQLHVLLASQNQYISAKSVTFPQTNLTPASFSLLRHHPTRSEVLSDLSHQALYRAAMCLDSCKRIINMVE